MLENFFLENGSNVRDCECNVFRKYFTIYVKNLSIQQIKSIISKLATVLFSTYESIYKSFVFIIVKVLDSFDCKISNKFDPILAIDVNVLLDIHKYIV